MSGENAVAPTGGVAGAPISLSRRARNVATGIAADSSSLDSGFIVFALEGQYAQASVEAKRSHPYSE